MNDLLKSEYFSFIKRPNIISFNLTKREYSIVFLITKGYRNKKIGEILFISESTVKKHIYNIFNKLSINSRYELLSKTIYVINNEFKEEASWIMDGKIIYHP